MRHHGSTSRGLTCWLTGLLLLAAAGAGAETNSRPTRLTVALLSFENQTGDYSASHWAYGLRALLDHALAGIETIRLRSDHAIDYCHRKLSLTAGDPITPAQARRMGELIEARRVVWGSYRRVDGQWQVTARVLHTADGTISDEFNVQAADGFKVCSMLATQLLVHLGVPQAEAATTADHPTTSAEAWEWFSRACELQARRRVLRDQRIAAEAAIKADPAFAEAHLLLGETLAAEGELESARAAFLRAKELKPALARAPRALGTLWLAEGKYDEAEGELRAALALEPEDARTLECLGEISLARNELAEAIAHWKAAKRLDRTRASIPARLGDAYARQGKREAALAELHEAARIESEDADTERLLGRVYDDLQEVPAAVRHYERYTALARKHGGDPAQVQKVRGRMREMIATFKPQEVTATRPKALSEADLDAALREHLTDEERSLVPNPLAGSPAMQRVAENLIRGSRSKFDQARKLFEPLARRLAPGVGGSRTAAEVFAGWNDAEIPFRCQEYARLYVALARSVGLEAYFTVVETDFRGVAVTHACAAVFIDDKGWLVDPAYRWFGVPHQKFQILDDFEAAVAYLHQQPGDIARCRIAAKLQPDSAFAQFNLALALLKQRRLNEAGVVLQRAVRLDPDSWLSTSTQGFVAAYFGRWPLAEALLRKSLASNPLYDKAHFFLGVTLRARGNLEEAREEFRAYLSHQDEPVFTDAALRAVAEINESLDAD